MVALARPGLGSPLLALVPHSMGRVLTHADIEYAKNCLVFLGEESSLGGQVEWSLLVEG